MMAGRKTYRVLWAALLSPEDKTQHSQVQQWLCEDLHDDLDKSIFVHLYISFFFWGGDDAMAHLLAQIDRRTGDTTLFQGAVLRLMALLCRERGTTRPNNFDRLITAGFTNRVGKDLVDVRDDAHEFIEAYSKHGDIHNEAILKSVAGISAFRHVLPTLLAAATSDDAPEPKGLFQGRRSQAFFRDVTTAWTKHLHKTTAPWANAEMAQRR
jgi:hypothetical protein